MKPTNLTGPLSGLEAPAEATVETMEKADKTSSSDAIEGPAMQNPRWLWWGMGLLVLFAMGSTAIAFQGM